jgi:hypothetical protein
MVEAEGNNVNEYITLAGVFFGGIVAGLLGYLRRKPETSSGSEMAVASVGMELGNKLQMDELIKAVNRVGDILENKKQAGIEKRLDELLERIDDIEDDHVREERDSRRR